MAPVEVTAPGILSEHCPEFVLLNRWPPNILCIHHNFHFAGTGLGQVSISYGSTGYFDFVQEGIGVRWKATQKYQDMLQEVTTWIATTQWPN
jgi:hypothetical protein